ncbi:hypothetical protein QBE53_10910 [Vallitaleaceae bacterium 9-2]
MKFHSPMIIVSDIEKSKKFYTDILHQTISVDLGTYVILEGFSMMTREAWKSDTQDTLVYDEQCGHGFELYFEESQFDTFINLLNQHESIKSFQPLTQAPWGQRTVRFLDPDNHVIEVAEPMEEVVLKFLHQGMTEQEVSEKTMMPIEFVHNCTIQ